MRINYYPGCSMVTTAKECDRSLRDTSQLIDLELVDLPDWNCCGSSSVHSLDRGISLDLALRNLSLVPKNEPLMVMCPSCLHNFHQAQRYAAFEHHRRIVLENRWNREIEPEVKVVHFLEVLGGFERSFLQSRALKELKGIRVAPYYGCMLASPPAITHMMRGYAGLMEELLTVFGARPILWPYITRCCGTFLSAAHPVVATEQVNQIIGSAIEYGAECLVTACAMCLLNLEIRCTLKKKIPTFYFTEFLALVLGSENWDGWFGYHIVDPRPFLYSKRII